jgi:ZIP family zinc transporter
MISAAFWGALGASTLLLGAVIAYRFGVSRKSMAVIMAVGSGLLIGSVAFELVDEALKTSEVVPVAIGVLLGAGAFTIGDWIIDHNGGAERADSSGGQAEGQPLAIVLGSVLDGVPESFVLGLTVLQGQVSIALLVAILLSNLPEGMSSSMGLRLAKWREWRVYRMWLIVVVVSAISAAAGFVLLDPASGRTGAVVQAFAAGALLAMLTDTLLPEAYEVEGVLTGPLVVVGFAVSIALSSLD